MIASRPDLDIVIACGLRTPFARAGGAYKREDAAHLGARVVREILDRAALDPGEIDQLICGCVGPPYDQANVGRVLALRAGLPQSTPAYTVGRNCASSMEAVTQAVTQICAGQGELYLAVGVEVMSAYPLVFGRRATERFAKLSRAKSLGRRLALLAGFRPRDFAPCVSLIEGLTDPTCGLIMGRTAELLARDFDIGREEADAFALESHRRAAAAIEAGRLESELLPHLPLGAREGTRSLVCDDGVRSDQTLERLARLGPYFEKPDGVVTVGNSCGITDGAAALIVTTAERAASLGLEIQAHIRSFAWAGLDPRRMGLGPVYASAGALDAAGCRLADMARIELNEAFATQVLACSRAFASRRFAREHLDRDQALGELDPQRLNPDGGAIAVGHPVGATGARLLIAAARGLAQSDGELALATLCIGGGQGGAVVLERRAA